VVCSRPRPKLTQRLLPYLLFPSPLRLVNAIASFSARVIGLVVSIAPSISLVSSIHISIVTCFVECGTFHQTCRCGIQSPHILQHSGLSGGGHTYGNQRCIGALQAGGHLDSMTLCRAASSVLGTPINNALLLTSKEIAAGTQEAGADHRIRTCSRDSEWSSC